MRDVGWMLRISATVLLAQAGLFLVRPSITYRALELGADEAQVGLLVVAFALLPAFLAVPMGRYGDRHRPSTIVRLGLALLVAGAVGAAFAADIVGLMLATIALGLGSVAMLTGSQAVVGRLSRHLDRDFGYLSAAVSLGQMLGPALLGLAIPTHGAVGPEPFVAGAVFCALGFATCWRFADRAPEHVGERSASFAMFRVLSFPGVPVTMIASLTILVAIDVLIVYLPLLGERNGLPAAVIGILLSIRAGASVVSRLFIGALLRRWSRTPILVSSVVASGVALGAVAFVEPLPALAALMIFLGLVLGLGQPLTMAVIVEAVPASMRGEALSFRIAGNKVGQVVLPALLAGVIGAATVVGAFVALGGILIASGTGLGVTRRRAARRAEPESDPEPSG